jgi:hypothetical protein
LKHFYAKDFTPFTEEEFRIFAKWNAILKEINMVYLTLESAKTDGIFIYLRELMKIVSIISSNISTIDLNAGQLLRQQLIKRLIKYERTNGMLTRLTMATTLNPDVDPYRILEDIEEFRNFPLIAETKIREILRSKLNSDILEDERGEEFDVHALPKNVDQLTLCQRNLHGSRNRTFSMTRYWRSYEKIYSDLTNIALEFCCCVSTSCDVERILSKVRSKLCYYMGASKPDKIS